MSRILFTSVASAASSQKGQVVKFIEIRVCDAFLRCESALTRCREHSYNPAAHLERHST